MVRRERLRSADCALDAGLPDLGDEVDGALNVHPEDVPVQLVEAEGKVFSHALVQDDGVHLVAANVQSVALSGDTHSIVDAPQTGFLHEMTQIFVI